MNALRVWMIVSWVALPTVMFGGFSLLQLLNRGDVLTPFQVAWFRAGHAHAGVLLLMSLLYYIYLDKTALSIGSKHGLCAALAIGILLQSGGFFVHMLVGQPNQASVGTAITVTGAVILAVAVIVLAFALYSAP